jgi:arylsulfatase A-like enzyme/Flp pilus assembly protein TadD
MRRTLALLILLASAAFGAESIVLVTLDTVRADRLSLHGYPQKTSPSLDAAAAKGLVFDRAYSIVPLTFPAHVAILTGQDPFATGLFLNGQQFVPDEGYLPSALKKRGYATAAFVSSAIMERTFGGAKDFDLYDDAMTRKALGEEVSERPAAETVARALAWMKTEKGPYFLWVHLFDPHAPYNPSKPWADRFAHPYDAEIAQMDAALGDLLKAVPKKAAVMIVGDHGEMLGEHGEEEHGVLLYQPAIHVPLVLLGGGVKPGREARPVSLLDCYPTLLALAGAPVPAGLKGTDLRALPAQERTLLASSLYGREVLGFLPSMAVVQGGFKLLAYGDRDYKLFDLAKDPGEADNLFLADRRRVREMRKAALEVQFPSSLQVAIRDEDKKKLTSLGYSTPKKTERLVHPEEGLQYERMLSEAKKLLAAGKSDEAELKLLALLDKAPGMNEARTMLGKIYTKSGRHAEAREVFAGLANQQAMDPKPRLDLARTLIAQGELDKAAAELRTVQTIDPRQPEAYGMLAQIHLAKRDWNALDALAAMARQYSVESTALFTSMGLAAKERKDLPAAERAFRDALELEPGALLPLKGLATVLYMQERKREALDAYRRLLETSPADREANYLAGLLTYQLEGKKLVALQYFNTALEGCDQPKFCDLVKEAIRKVEQ